jgi:hypothetical protein
VYLNHRHTTSVGVRKRIEQDILDDTKNGGGGADAEREIEDGEERERRAIGKSAYAVTKVLPQRPHTSHLSPQFPALRYLL